MKTNFILSAAISLICLLTMPSMMKAQSADEQAIQKILKKDSLFWMGYNKCDTTGYNQMFTKDLEFYHDKGGITLGADTLAMTLQRNLCSNPDFRLRREEVKGTVKVFMLHNSGVIYGAILSGEHVFFVLEKGKDARLDGKAKFTHLWLLTDNVWKMKRILSYDHGPANR